MTMESGITTQEHVVLVNEQDEVLGTMEKLEAHRTGALHRAFSVFLFDDEGRLLLQQRAASKYHSALLWTNTCCSHPRLDESLEMAAKRRLAEEMGMDADLEHRFSFIYNATFENGLQEHELDHVFFGRASGPPQPDPSEVNAWRFVGIDVLRTEMERSPAQFTAWLHHCWPMLMAALVAERA
ncbi:MAG TPA: isopentenyl-diphosphate Delta-isomerase [Flavobacteriales bacterium]|nr:isopentenyl-diphosphate Delta-isomerase [Flavobacteriales bacterium]